MKKSFLVLLIIFSVAISAQEKQNSKEITGSSLAFILESEIFDNIGISWEYRKKSDKKEEATIFNLIYSSCKVGNDFVEYKGIGATIQFGKRFYFKSSKKSKLYFETLHGYSRIKFKDETYSGKYETINLINATFGYNIIITKDLILNPYVGYVWNLETKGQGDVDNKSFDNSNLKLGIKLGYKF